MIVPSMEDICTSSHIQIFLGTVWHPRHLRQLNRELHDDFNPGISFYSWRSSSLPRSSPLFDHQPSCAMSNKEHFSRQKLTCVSHSTPSQHTIHPMRLPYCCDMEPQPKAGSRVRLQKGKMTFRTEVNVVWSTATMEVAIPQPAPH